MSLTQTSEKSKRIANNTGAIYIRMIVVMLVTLYTSRVVLQQLGVIDFGINNVVAGIVSLLAFFSSSLSNAAQRYLSIGLGEHNTPKTRLYFRQSFSLMVIFSVAIFVLAETVDPCIETGCSSMGLPLCCSICSLFHPPSSLLGCNHCQRTDEDVCLYRPV